MNIFLDLSGNFIALFIESAPWLLLGLLVAGIMHELVPVSLLNRHMGTDSLSAIGKAAVIGAPLPLCSCGVIPAALGLRRSGVSKSSTISFLVATPETGVDSVSVSYALLGPVFAIVRPFAAIFSAIYAGLLVKFLGDESPHQSLTETSCCANKAKTVSSCCESHTEKTQSILTKTKDVLSFSAGKLLKDITVWLLIGLGMAAIIKTFVPTDFLSSWGDGFLAMLIMALIGIPMYICATASTPIALGFLAAGVSPGAILVFMLAGPATNVSTMGMISKEMGKRTLMLYLFAVISSSIGLGYLLNWGFSTFEWTLPNTLPHAHEHSSLQGIYTASAIILAILMLKNQLSASLSWMKKQEVHQG
uniref:SO_0444 family Cu/Zn efflux transporter n=1 Tax=Ningiella ruwaisensis TaxID=2364274 RepID=UPI0010A02003|nr:SO_0444 family Cu/Zn efflux transporter [Ningiella ruwaisensis]